MLFNLRLLSATDWSSSPKMLPSYSPATTVFPGVGCYVLPPIFPLLYRFSFVRSSWNWTECWTLNILVLRG